VVGPPLFVATFLIEGATRRGYDPVRLQVSYLSLGDQGWIQIANFCVCGVLAIFFAWGLRQALQSGRGVAPVDLRDQEVARYLADGWGSEAKELAWVAVVVGGHHLRVDQ
jgi:hypothetical protein